MMRFPFAISFGKRAAAPAAPAAPAELGPPKRRGWFGRTLGGMFKSAQVNPLDKWAATPTAPDAFIQRYHSTLVARSREQWSNNDYSRKYIELMRKNVVGPKGVTMQARVTKPRGALDKDVNAAIEVSWEDWSGKGNCEVTGKLTWIQVQWLLLETTARDGEFFLRYVYGTDAGPHGFAVQLIDSQRCPVWYENYNRGDGSFIRHGIEFNRYGRPIAYHFASTDEWDAYFYTVAGRGFVRIPADEIEHGFLQEMIGQRRGLPWASTSLFRLHHMEGFESAAVQNARAGAAQMGFIEYEEGKGPEADEDVNVADTIEAEPLSFHELPEGARLKEFKPTYPSGEFAVFVKAMLRGAASGMGVPYNELANDLENVNFSSIRQGTLDAREGYKEKQTWLIDSLHKPVYAAWLKYSLLSAAIKVRGEPLSPAKLDTFRRQVTWQPRRWPWIDPKSDVTASVTAIRAGLTSMSQVIRDAGGDPEQVRAEIADDYKQMLAAGIEADIVKLMFGLMPAPEPSPGKADESVAKEPAK